jgi:histone deacetylase 6
MAQPDIGYTRSDSTSVRAHQTRELATYIWENYIEYVCAYMVETGLTSGRPYDATQVFFMGIGDAYLGLVDLLSLNGKPAASS